MGLIIKLIILVALIKLLLQTEKPWLCAAIYAGAGFLLALMVGYDLFPVIIATAFGFALAGLYFSLLLITQNSGVFWLVLIVGLLIGLV